MSCPAIVLFKITHATAANTNDLADPIDLRPEIPVTQESGNVVRRLAGRNIKMNQTVLTVNQNPRVEILVAREERWVF